MTRQNEPRGSTRLQRQNEGKRSAAMPMASRTDKVPHRAAHFNAALCTHRPAVEGHEIDAGDTRAM